MEIAQCNLGDVVGWKEAFARRAPRVFLHGMIPLSVAASAAQSAALHERLFTIDTHSDTPTASFLREGWDFAARHDATTDRYACRS